MTSTSQVQPGAESKNFIHTLHRRHRVPPQWTLSLESRPEIKVTRIPSLTRPYFPNAVSLPMGKLPSVGKHTRFLEDDQILQQHIQNASPIYQSYLTRMGLYDKEANISNESIYSVDSDVLNSENAKEFHVYNKHVALCTQNAKYIQNADKSPAYYADYHYYRPSNLKERFVSLYAGDSPDGKLLSQIGSNWRMTKFHFNDANGHEHSLERTHDTRLTISKYGWAIPDGRKLIWKNTRQLDMGDTKRSKIRRSLKLVDENNEIVAMFVGTKFAKRKLGKFILDTNYANSPEFEQGVLITGLAILEIYAITGQNAAAASSSSSSAVAAATV
ncbi:hypothetical protein H072_5846 [Dactylellina haptotyla CBS 200.50]|uniref:Uncharacterized protein n=1 Tax=Dactylellina haptotyla (strain CBS 200.50) TaxID=1284197 RepID=S8ABS5_DACHA|nr:hypothetical protein H072_5846 [Dactylellina haptotyla CBS 200.50]